jgi:hypothetical protein
MKKIAECDNASLIFLRRWKILEKEWCEREKEQEEKAGPVFCCEGHQ